MRKKYERDFYLQDTFEVAKQLLGAYLSTYLDGHLTSGMIVEVEPYIGGIDKASHSYQGRRTQRTEIQFGPGGHAYVYLIYGMYSQFCVVTGPENVSDVILIRALEPTDGIDVMKQRRNQSNKNNLTNGPGKLCMALGITTELYGEDLCGDKIWIAPPNANINPDRIVAAKRIGIDYAEEFADKLWRFHIKDNKFVSKKAEDAVPLSEIELPVYDYSKIQIPTTISLISWNVNGIRSIQKNGFLNWLSNTKPDILCLQETKAEISQLSSDLTQPAGYYAYWNSAKRRGYSGTALLSREEPLSVEFGLGIAEFDQEGRTIIAEYPDFTLISCYFPHGGRDNSRVPFKLAFYEAFLAKCEQLRAQGRTAIFCGDVNTAHKEIDLARPESNQKNTGFLHEERAWLDKVIQAGYIDTFRHFHPNLSGQYTWWSVRTNARERNVGWRLDYFFIVAGAIEKVTDTFIMSEVTGSDHCPVGILLNVEARRESTIKEIESIYYQARLL